MNPLHDLVCPDCGYEMVDVRFSYAEIGDGIICPKCGAVMEILYDRPIPFKLIGKDWTSGGRT